MADETKRNMTIVKSEVANTLTSAASNHIIATATDVYDKDLELYQSEINQLINNMSADNVTSIAAEDIDPKLAKVEFNEAEKTITVTDKDDHSYTFKIKHYGTGWGDDYDDSYCEDGMLPNFGDFQLKMDHLIDVDGDHTVSGAIMKLKDKIKPVEVGYGLEVQSETGIIDAEVEYAEGGDDAARRILGGGWRLPSANEWMEVLNYCDFNVEAVKATIPGVEITSKTNGNSIFLPYRGYVTGSPDNPTQGTTRAAYWGNDIETGAIHGQGIGNAHNIDIQTTTPPYLGDSPHWIGLPIRPVSMSEGVDLGLPSGIRFAESNLTATGLAEHDYDYGDYFAWAEITPKETYTQDNCKYGFPSTKYTVSTLTSLDEDGNKYITRHGDELQTKIVPGEHQQVLTSIVDENGNRTMEWREVPDPAKAEYEADKILYGGPITLTNLLAIANPQVGEFYQVYNTQDGDVFSGDFDYDGNHLNEGTFLKWNGERWIFDEKHEQKQFLSSYLYNRSYSIYPFGDRNGSDNGKWALIWQWTTSNIDKTGVSFVNKVMCADNQMGYSMKFTVDSRSTKDTDMPYSFVDVEYLVPNLTGTKSQDYFGEDPFDLRTFIRVTAIDNVYRVYARVWYDMNGMSGVDVLFPGYSVNLDGFATPVPLSKREDLMTWDQHIGNEITRINYNREVPTKTVKFKVPEESFIGEGYTITNRGVIEHGPSKDQNGNTVWQTATKVDIQLDPAYDKYIVFTDNNVLYKSITAIGSDKGRTFRNGAKLILMADSISAWDHTYHGISVWSDANCDNSEFTIDKFGYTSAYTSTLLWQYTMREEFVWWNGKWWGTQYTPVYTTSTIGTGTYSKLPPTAEAVYKYVNEHSGAPAAHTHKTSDVTSLEGYEKYEYLSNVTPTDSLNNALGKLAKYGDLQYSIHNANNIINTNVELLADGYISQASHSFVSDDTGRFKCSGPISVRGASTIEFSANGWCNHTDPDSYDLVQLVFCDKDMYPISDLDIRVDDITTQTIDLTDSKYANVYYVILSGDQNGYAVPRTYLRIKGGIDLNSFVSSDSFTYHQGYNLFDVNHIEYKKGITSAGEFIDDSQAMCSNLIILPEDRGRNNGLFLSGLPTTSYSKRFVYYDENMNIVAGPSDIGASVNSAQIGCPDTAKYFRISIIRAVAIGSEDDVKRQLKNVMITLQYGMQNHLQPYHREIETINGDRIAASSLAGLYAGKKWGVMGDSLTEHNSRSTKFYYEYIKEWLGMEVINYGASGTGYMARQDVAEELRPTEGAFYQRIDSVGDVDLLTIFGSFNDLTDDSREIGTVDDSGTDTICGCINTLLSEITAKHHMLNFAIISPCPWKEFTPIGDTETSRRAIEYVVCLQEICERNSIPFLDLFHNSGLRPWERHFRDTYYNLDMETNGDYHGTHPNALGHERLATRIKQFIQTLF